VQLYGAGWGGHTIDPAHWTPHERTEGPSLWGHDRLWLTEQGREEARALRIRAAQSGSRELVNVMDGNYTRAADVCPGGTPTCKRAKSDNSEPDNSRSANYWHRHCEEQSDEGSLARTLFFFANVRNDACASLISACAKMRESRYRAGISEIFGQ